MTLAQLAATGGYVAWFAFGDAPGPLSFGVLAFALLPPAVFAFLVVAGMFGVSSAHLVTWQRLLSGLGSAIASCGALVSLILLPLILLGSLVDYAIG